MVVKGSFEKVETKRICDMDFNLTKSIFDGDIFGIVENDFENLRTYAYSVIAK
jgi:hypothetical protein